MKKWMKAGTKVRRKKPYFDAIFVKGKSFFDPFDSIEEYYLQEGTVVAGGSHIVRVKWNDGREYKYGLAVLQEISNQWSLDDKLFEI